MYEYEDYYNEVSEADIIVNEAVDKLKEIIKEPILNDLRDAYQWKLEHSEKQNELKKINREISNLKEELKGLLSKKDNLPREFLNQVLNEVYKELSIGQTIYYVIDNPFETICKRCNGTATVKELYHDGTTTEIRCSCYDGKETEYKKEVKSGKINYIGFNLAFNKQNMSIKPQQLDNFKGYIQLEGREEMSFYDTKNIFITEQDALNYINNLKEQADEN